tara:strand:- start:67 stop:354 length:288 start_codon:yes stop_codon:yes gene_type:complete
MTPPLFLIVGGFLKYALVAVSQFYCSKTLLQGRFSAFSIREQTTQKVLIGLDFELHRNLMIQIPTAGTSLSTMSEKSVFTYLEQQRQQSSAGLGS